MAGTLERLKQYIDNKGISTRAFEMAVGFSNGAFASQLKNNKTIGVDKLENILTVYPELNANWVLTGRGLMLLSNEISSNFIAEPNPDYQMSAREMLELQRDMIATQKDLIMELKNQLGKDQGSKIA